MNWAYAAYRFYGGPSWDNPERREYGEHAARRLDNLARCLGAAGMIATIEKRCEQRAFRLAFERMEGHLRSGWHLGAP